METFEQEIFNRIKLMRITACLISLLGAFLLTAMIIFCQKKVIIISDYEETGEAASEAKSPNTEVVWQIKNVSSNEEGLHIPIESEVFEYDMDYVNKVFIFKISDEKGKFYMENMPHGDFSFFKSATGKFDGNFVTYSMPMEKCLEPEVEIVGGEAVFSFAPIDHNKTIVLIDPGHGGSAVGSMAGGLMEKEVSLKIAQKIRKLAEGKDYKVVLTRSTDRKVGTGECLSIINITEADYYISIHLDADIEDTKKFGLRAAYNADYYRDGYENVDFADSLLKNVAMTTSNKANELVKAGKDELVLEILQIPAATLYMGYISNAAEADLLSKDEYIEKIALGVINSLDESLEK